MEANEPPVVRILQRCAYCKDPARRENTLNCPACNATHHIDCFKQYRCATFGCPGCATFGCPGEVLSDEKNNSDYPPLGIFTTKSPHDDAAALAEARHVRRLAEEAQRGRVAIAPAAIAPAVLAPPRAHPLIEWLIDNRFAIFVALSILVAGIMVLEITSINNKTIERQKHDLDRIYALALKQQSELKKWQQTGLTGGCAIHFEEGTPATAPFELECATIKDCAVPSVFIVNINPGECYRSSGVQVCAK